MGDRDWVTQSLAATAPLWAFASTAPGTGRLSEQRNRQLLITEHSPGTLHGPPAPAPHTLCGGGCAGCWVSLAVEGRPGSPPSLYPGAQPLPCYRVSAQKMLVTRTGF